MLSKSKNIHFIGIGGIGMSGIAELLHCQGFMISGSDLFQSERTDYLNKIGIKIIIEHNKKNIINPDLVVYSSAVNLDNIEIIEAKEKGIPVIRRAEMLGELLKLKKISIAISGSQGKTTTCSMLSSILFFLFITPLLISSTLASN